MKAGGRQEARAPTALWRKTAHPCPRPPCHGTMPCAPSGTPALPPLPGVDGAKRIRSDSGTALLSYAALGEPGWKQLELNGPFLAPNEMEFARLVFTRAADVRPRSPDRATLALLGESASRRLRGEVREADGDRQHCPHHRAVTTATVARPGRCSLERLPGFS